MNHRSLTSSGYFAWFQAIESRMSSFLQQEARSRVQVRVLCICLEHVAFFLEGYCVCGCFSTRPLLYWSAFFSLYSASQRSLSFRIREIKLIMIVRTSGSAKRETNLIVVSFSKISMQEWGLSAIVLSCYPKSRWPTALLDGQVGDNFLKSENASSSRRVGFPNVINFRRNSLEIDIRHPILGTV